MRTILLLIVALLCTSPTVYKAIDRIVCAVLTTVR